MKTQFLSIAFLILISASGALAQTIEEQISKIRQITVETNRRIDAGLKDKTSGLHHATWTLGGVRDGQPWGEDVGAVNTAVEYYFDCEPERLEQCVTEDGKTPVRKAVTSYQGLEGLRYKSEFFSPPTRANSFSPPRPKSNPTAKRPNGVFISSKAN